MDYKEKYMDALSRAKKQHDSAKELGFDANVINLEVIFPELKESEDEIIKNEIIAFVEQSIHRGGGTPISQEQENKWLTWIEKQGEQTKEWSEEDEYLLKETIEHLEELIRIDKKHFSGHDVPYYQRDIDWLKSLKFKKQGNQLVDKVEPKFKVGDWLQYRYAEPFLVEEITEQGYCNGNSCLPFEWEDEIHLWTIQDAKDGDVITNGESIVIFKQIVEPKYRQYIEAYIGLDWGGNIQVTSESWSLGIDKAMPATKEQRDLLFQKMKEAGYEWNSDKKELKKVELEFHEGDWVVYNNDICQIVKREEGCNKLVTVFGIEKELVNERNLSTARLWSIQDARDGDVLVASDGSIFLFAGVDDCACKYYVALTSDNYVKINKETEDRYWETSRAVHPATKEQRDLLFEKMKEAGYEWDQKEKKPIKMKEPKFKVRDWVILNGTIAQILDKQKYGFAGLDVDGKDFFCNYWHIDSMHLWTIQDAKDGDILCYETDELKWILIFKDIVPVSSLVPHDSLRYHALLSNNEVYGSDIIAMVSDDIDYYCRPATKEECDLLFQKMREVNTEWDAEKKELRKIDTYQLNENPCSGCTNTKGCITCVNGDQKSTSTPRMLYSDEVIEWLDDNICNAYDYDGNDISTTLKSKFKQYFGLC